MRPWMRRLAMAVVIGAILGGTAFVLFRVRGLSLGYVELRIFTDDASGLVDGTQVRLNGIPIGYLETQKQTRSLDLMRKVELDLRVRNSYLDQIPVDSVAGLASDTLLGDQYIAIHRGQSDRHIEAGAELRTTQAQDIGKMMARFGQQMDRLQSMSDRIDKLIADVNAGHGSMGKIVNDPSLQQAKGMSTEIQGMIHEMQHGKGTIAKLFYDDPLSAQMESPKKRLDDIMAEADHRTSQMKELSGELDRAKKEFQTLQAELKAGKGSLGKLDALQQSIDGLTVKWDAMMDRINSGQGTLGQFMVNPQLNEALDATMREAQALAQGLKTNPKKFITIKIF